MTRNQLVRLKAGNYLVMYLYYPDLISSRDSKNTAPFLNFALGTLVYLSEQVSDICQKWEIPGSS